MSAAKKEATKRFHENNPHMKSIYDKRYREKHEKKVKEQKKKYLQTENGRKGNMLRVWKHRGVHIENKDELWKKYTEQTECDFCHKTLNKKYIEHNHFSKEIRGIVCPKCNQHQRRKDATYAACLTQLLKL